MQGRNKLILFVLGLIVTMIITVLIKNRLEPEYYYAHKELQLNFEGKRSLSIEKTAFLEDLIRSVQYANYLLNKKRLQLDKITNKFDESGQLNSLNKHRLNAMISKFGLEKQLKSDSVSISNTLQELDLRVQMVPIKLALAQGILESAWGTSRFAKEGNAYFGIHCYSEGCGMEFGNNKNKVFVKTYDDLQSSVLDYMHFLNTKRGPYKFRIARKQYYNSDKKNLKKLTHSLDSYSEIGGEYQKIIFGLYRNYIPNEIADY